MCPSRGQRDGIHRDERDERDFQDVGFSMRLLAGSRMERCQVILTLW